MKHWYAVQTRPRQETTAEENLRRQDYETYLPKIQVRKRRRDKWTKVVEPLFPRYLFIQVDADQQSLAPVRSTLGVASLVRFGQVLRPVPDNIIAYLKQVEDPETHQREDDLPRHRAGDKLEVLEGPFAGLKGIYQMPKGDDRALLLLTLLGRPTKIAFPTEALSPC